LGSRTSFYTFSFTKAVYSFKIFHKKGSEKTPSNKEQRGKYTTGLSMRNKKACHSINNALLQSVAGIGTQRTMKSMKKTLHEFSPHTPKTVEREHKYIDARNVACGHTFQNATNESLKHLCD
jgi:hypothetical protein